METVRHAATMVAKIFSIAVVVLLSLAAFTWLLFAVLPDSIADKLSYDVHGLFGATPYDPWLEGEEDLGSQEETNVLAAQFKIANWIKECEQLASPFDLPEDLKVLLFFGPDIGSSALDSSPENKIVINRLQVRLAFLSNGIHTQRILLDQAAKSSYLFLQCVTFVQIFIGLMTTILVSLSATELGKSTTPVWTTVRMLAMIFPAIGTAAAALIAFYSPSQAYASQQQVLSGLGELHRQVADEVLRLDCPTDDATSDAWNKVSQKIGLWEDQYAMLVNATDGTESDQSKEKPAGQTGNATTPPAATGGSK